MEDGFGDQLKSLHIAMEIKSTETIKQAMIAGMGIRFLSAHTISVELKAKSLGILDVRGFPVMLNWYVVHRRNKRLPPVALAFKNFLMNGGARLIEKFVPSPVKPSPTRKWSAATWLLHSGLGGVSSARRQRKNHYLLLPFKVRPTKNVGAASRISSSMMGLRKNAIAFFSMMTHAN